MPHGVGYGMPLTYSCTGNGHNGLSHLTHSFGVKNKARERRPHSESPTDPIETSNVRHFSKRPFTTPLFRCTITYRNLPRVSSGTSGDKLNRLPNMIHGTARCSGRFGSGSMEIVYV
jgi:hypothetical protein